MAPIRREVLRYLEEACPGSSIEPLPGDASTRSFYRVRLGAGRTRILMDYGSPFRGETDDMRLSRIFAAAGLPVARIEGASAQAGCLLLEDLGDLSLETALQASWARGAHAEALKLVEQAVELAAAVALHGTPVLAKSDRAAGPALDAERFRFEMDYFLEHYARGFRRQANLPAALQSALHALADAAAESPRRVLCHRDFHSRNLMVTRGHLAMVDIQDARWGPDTYDLASLLYDAYIDLEARDHGHLIERFRAALDPAPPLEEFQARFEIVAAQRMLKALGTFGYQVHVRGRQLYLPAMERTVKRLRQFRGQVLATCLRELL